MIINTEKSPNIKEQQWRNHWVRGKLVKDKKSLSISVTLFIVIHNDIYRLAIRKSTKSLTDFVIVTRPIVEFIKFKFSSKRCIFRSINEEIPTEHKFAIVFFINILVVIIQIEFVLSASDMRWIFVATLDLYKLLNL